LRPLRQSATHGANTTKISGGMFAIRVIALVSTVALIGAACTGDQPSDEQAAGAANGGVLRVGVLTNGEGPACTFTLCGPVENDPQIAGIGTMGFEIERCCLIRTLLSYNGRPTGSGGGILRPDLATALPEVSADGLTWTFHLKRRIHYAPPLDDTVIEAGDFIRSIERAMSPRPAYIPEDFGPVLDSYTVEFLDLHHLVAGAEEYLQGRAEHISGLSAPDPYTLIVHLTRPTGNLGYVLSQPDMAPIPPNPYDSSADFGVAQGHERLYFSYLVSSGPYMIDGAQDLDFSKPPNEQMPASGDAPDSLTLVRNPSWNPATDSLRLAAADRIVLTPVPDEKVAERLLSSGELDLVFNWEPPPALLGTDAAGGGTRAFATPRDWVVFLDLNVAIPPLDDVHLRRAMNFAVAREPLVPLWERAGLGATVATHLGLDSEENNLLLNFDPYDAATGNLKMARREMAKSRYDRDGDGECDVSACRGLDIMARVDQPAQVEAARAVAKQLRDIGIELHVDVPRINEFLSSYGRPQERIPIRLDQWIKDLPSGATYFPALFGTPATGITQGNNQSNLGARPAQLRRWGYEVTDVPSVDDRIKVCLSLTFGPQTRCWADLDAYLTTEIAPWVPLVSLSTGRVTSSRVASFSFDQSSPTPMPSLDRIVLRSDVRPRPQPSPSHAIPEIPEGAYRVTITKADLHRFDPHDDPGGLNENSGTVTMFIGDGHFKTVQFANHPIFNPIGVGIYRGSDNRVVFELQRPSFNAITTPPMRWRFDGRALHLKFLGCGTLNKLDPKAPRLCDDIRALYEAHPWRKID
jgi:peptide/nickel transport system substrate-binding protein